MVLEYGVQGSVIRELYLPPIYDFDGPQTPVKMLASVCGQLTALKTMSPSRIGLFQSTPRLIERLNRALLEYTIHTLHIEVWLLNVDADVSAQGVG